MGESGTEAFFESALHTFHAAAERSGIVRSQYRIGDRTVRLEFAGTALTPLRRALAHLETADATPPNLTVEVWDSESTGTRPLERNWIENDRGEPREASFVSGERFHSEFHDVAGIRYMLDSSRDLGLYCIEDARDLPLYEKAAPMRPLLHAWLHRQGLVPAHAGAVGFEWGGVLLAGKGGRGKSCTALSCVGSNLGYASDDFCVLASAPRWTGYSMYGTGKLHRRDLERFGHLAQCPTESVSAQEEKVVFFLNEHAPSQMLSRFPILAVLLPTPASGGETQVAAISSSVVYRELSMSTILMAPPTVVPAFRSFARLLREVPCFELRIGADSRQIPGVICDLIYRLAGRAKGSEDANSL